VPLKYNPTSVCSASNIQVAISVASVLSYQGSTYRVYGAGGNKTIGCLVGYKGILIAHATVPHAELSQFRSGLQEAYFRAQLGVRLRVGY